MFPESEDFSNSEFVFMTVDCIRRILCAIWQAVDIVLRIDLLFAHKPPHAVKRKRSCIAIFAKEHRILQPCNMIGAAVSMGIPFQCIIGILSSKRTGGCIEPLRIHFFAKPCKIKHKGLEPELLFSAFFTFPIHISFIISDPHQQTRMPADPTNQIRRIRNTQLPIRTVIRPIQCLNWR